MKKQTNFEIVGRLLDDFRGHPERGADESVPFYLGVGQLARHPEIRQFDLALLGQQHVGGWNNSVFF